MSQAERGSKKDTELLLDKGFTTSDLIMSTCSQNQSSCCDETNCPMDIIDRKKDVDCSRDADGYKLSPHKRYLLSNIEHNPSYLKKLGLDSGSMLKNARVVNKR